MCQLNFAGDNDLTVKKAYNMKNKCKRGELNE